MLQGRGDGACGGREGLRPGGALLLARRKGDADAGQAALSLGHVRSCLPASSAHAQRFHARFQSFEETADGSAGPAGSPQLRAELARRGIGGYVVPRAECAPDEYVAPGEERLAWLTGFTGSARPY